MQKILLLIAIIWLINFLSGYFRKKKVRQPQDHVEKMVRCAQCDLFVSARKAVYSNNLSFCCKEHSDQYDEIHK